jgi:hypothetical protein
VPGTDQDTITRTSQPTRCHQIWVGLPNWTACKTGGGDLQVHPKAQQQDGNKISMDLPSVFDKLVTRERGGYCFEQNTLLAAALTTMGFWWGAPPSSRPWVMKLWCRCPD